MAKEKDVLITIDDSGVREDDVSDDVLLNAPENNIGTPVTYYSVEISLILDGMYVEDSDIQLPLFANYEIAKAYAQNITFQTPELYEVYLYTLDANYNMLESERIH